MVTEAQKFAARLNEVLDDLGYPPKNRGRNTRLAKDWGLSTTAVRKWVEGDGMPDTKRIGQMAVRYRVNAHWLMTGRGSKAPNGIPNAELSPGPALRQIPLITWGEVAAWENRTKDPHGEKMVNTTTTMGARGFAVIVEGDAMAPRFPAGGRLDVDPDVEVVSSNFVLAIPEGGEVAVFRQYIVEGGRRLLSPINNRYQVERCGKIIGRVMAYTEIL